MISLYVFYASADSDEWLQGFFLVGLMRPHRRSATGPVGHRSSL